MNPLEVEPTEAQARLLEVIYRGRRLAGGPRYYPAGYKQPQEVGREPDAWPIFQYVEGVLYQEHGLDASSLILGAPSVRLGNVVSRYGWIQVARGPGLAEEKVRLTIAGLSKVPDAAAEVQVFIDTLAFLVERERRFVPDPSQVVQVEVWSGEIKDWLNERWELQIDDQLEAIPDLLAHEPATWHCQVRAEEARGWRVILAPFIRPYAGVSTAADYLERLFGVISPPATSPAPLHRSSLSLPEALDYLNAVWRANVGNGEPLFRISRAEAAAKLALDCSIVDEFESRLSAVAGILAQLRLPRETGDKKLIDLRKFLGQILSDDSATRAQDAVNVLRDVVALRVWRQHPGTEEVAADAARRLGVALPSESWGATWDHIRERAVSALSAIREEIERLPPLD